MNLIKGDLVLISDEERVYTCIILTERYSMGSARGFYYCHCLETGQNGIVYEQDIVSLVLKGFNPEFQHDSNFFGEEDWYDLMMECFSLWPMFWPPDDPNED